MATKIELQVEKALKRKLSQNKLESIAEQLGEKMIEFIKEKTESGEGVPNGVYDNVYKGQDYIKRHKGGRASPVTLRKTGKSMNSLRTENGTTRGSSRGSSRVKGGWKLRVWNDHKKYRRQILPERADQVPLELKQEAIKLISNELTGR